MIARGINEYPEKKIWPSELRMGAFEVYFMGIQLFSKIKTSQWPNIEYLAKKCRSIYDDYMSGAPIYRYETFVQFESGEQRVLRTQARKSTSVPRQLASLQMKSRSSQNGESAMS